MDSKLLSHTAPGIYGSLHRAAGAVGLDLTLEAHAYLNQEDDEFVRRNFILEKSETYGDLEAFMRAMGVRSIGELEGRMIGALSVSYFYSLPIDKLKRAASFLNCHSSAGRTVLERMIVRSARESLSARLGGFTIPLKSLSAALVLFILAAYVTALIQQYTASGIFFGLSAFTLLGRVIMEKMIKKAYYVRTAGTVNVAAAENVELQKSISLTLGRFYPGFDW